MNRRKFFKWLGMGTAVAIVAPTALFPEGPALVWQAGTHYNTTGSTLVDEYVDYTNFSSLAISASIDESVTKAAKELSASAGREMASLLSAVSA